MGKIWTRSILYSACQSSRTAKYLHYNAFLENLKATKVSEDQQCYRMGLPIKICGQL